MTSPSGEHTIAILLAAIKQYDVRDNLNPSALFLAEDQGFSVYCTKQKTPAKFMERQAQTMLYGTLRNETCHFVGRCHWLWSDNQHDVIGVSFRTDIISWETNITWGYADERMAEQNMLQDILWVGERVLWLWQTALPAIPIKVVIEDKIDIHEYVDWADFSSGGSVG